MDKKGKHPTARIRVGDKSSLDDAFKLITGKSLSTNE